jgi:small subunit ribosomal protein S4e
MKKHLKRLRIPSFWKIAKKHAKWAVKPRAGPHKQFESIPLIVILRDILEIADKGKDASSIIKMGGVHVDGKPRKDPKYPAGIMDVVSIPKFKMHYRVVPTTKGLELLDIDTKESKKKLCMIKNKSTVCGNKIQLNLHDSRNILVDPKDSKYKTGDSVLIELPSQKILDHVKLEKGALALISKGKNIGLVGKIEDMILTKTNEPTKIICNINGEKLEVIKDYVFVVGKNKPLIKIGKDD